MFPTAGAEFDYTRRVLPRTPSFLVGWTMATGLMVAAAGHISGGVYNPAVAIGLLLARKLTPVQAITYIIAEVLGGLLGVGGVGAGGGVF